MITIENAEQIAQFLQPFSNMSDEDVFETVERLYVEANPGESLESPLFWNRAELLRMGWNAFRAIHLKELEEKALLESLAAAEVKVFEIGKDVTVDAVDLYLSIKRFDDVLEHDFVEDWLMNSGYARDMGRYSFQYLEVYMPVKYEPGVALVQIHYAADC